MTELDEIRAILRDTVLLSQQNTQQIEATRQIVDSQTQQLLTTQQIVDSQTQQLLTTQQIVDSNARAIEANSVAIAELRQGQSVAAQELRTNVQDVVAMITTQAEQAESDRAIMLEIQSEVRGLQTENRRIWEILQGDREA